MKHSKITVFGLFALSGCLFLMNGCGPKESQAGTLGALTGAAIGAAVGDEEGALVGAAIGAAVGSSIGRSEDRRDEEREHQEEVRQLESEKHQLEQELDRWCDTCGRKSRIRGAQSCSHCGGKLIREKFCDRCKTRFKPSEGHRYCPYCSVKTRLKSR